MFHEGKRCPVVAGHDDLDAGHDGETKTPAGLEGAGRACMRCRWAYSAATGFLVGSLKRIQKRMATTRE